jgi:hypothetical protein
MAFNKKIFVVDLKHSSFLQSADPKYMSNDLEHVMPWQCMFALTLCISLWSFTTYSIFVERKVCYSPLFTNLVGRHASAVSFPLSDVILAPLACPLSDIKFCLHSRITNLSLYKHWDYCSNDLGFVTQ